LTLFGHSIAKLVKEKYFCYPVYQHILYNLKTELSILIVEDEPSFALELEMLVQDIGYKVAAVVDNSADALEVIFDQAVDFILMDIDIRGKLSGTEIGKRIRFLNIPILFITSFGNEAHYEEALKSNFAGYLVKPIDKYTLRTSITLAISNLFLRQEASQRQGGEDGFVLNEFLFFKKDRVYHKVAERDIVLVEGADDYVKVHLSDETHFLLRKTLKVFERLLTNTDFLRIHRSYIVRLSAIKTIDFNDKTLTILDKEIPLSRQRRSELEKMVRRVD